MNAVASVSTRIAEIEARIARLAPTVPPGFTLPAATAAGGTAAPAVTPMAAAGTGTAAPALASGGDVPAWAASLPPEGRAWAPAIADAARAAGVDERLLAALVQQESGFRPDARSSAGAIGLAQLMPGTAAGLGVDPHQPLENLRGGARFLREQLDRFGRVDLALAAYNAGPGRVARAGGVPEIRETQNYVRVVQARYEELRR